MITKEQAIEDGLSEEQADYMIECERQCDSHYEYETTHQDAADSYEHCFECSQHEIESIRFDSYPVSEPDEQTIFLGQCEVEIQFDTPLDEKEADYFSQNTDYVVNVHDGRDSSDLAYRMYPGQLLVVAKLQRYEMTKREKLIAFMQLKQARLIEVGIDSPRYFDNNDEIELNKWTDALANKTWNTITKAVDLGVQRLSISACPWCVANSYLEKDAACYECGYAANHQDCLEAASDYHKIDMKLATYKYTVFSEIWYREAVAKVEAM